MSAVTVVVMADMALVRAVVVRGAGVVRGVVHDLFPHVLRSGPASRASQA